MSNENTPALELQAAEQRRRLRQSVEELKSIVREKTDVHHLVSEYALKAAGAATLLGLVVGYGVAGIFTRH